MERGLEWRLFLGGPLVWRHGVGAATRSPSECPNWLIDMYLYHRHMYIQTVSSSGVNQKTSHLWSMLQNQVFKINQLLVRQATCYIHVKLASQLALLSVSYTVTRPVSGSEWQQEIEVTSAANNFLLPAINQGVRGNKHEAPVHRRPPQLWSLLNVMIQKGKCAIGKWSKVKMNVGVEYNEISKTSFVGRWLWLLHLSAKPFFLLSKVRIQEENCESKSHFTWLQLLLCDTLICNDDTKTDTTSSRPTDQNCQIQTKREYCLVSR